MYKKSIGILDTKFFIFVMVLFLTACTSKEEVEVSPVIESVPNEIETPTPPVEEEIIPAAITWENWYLSVPINRGNGSATSIGYQDIVGDKLTAAESEYFYQNEDGSYTCLLYTSPSPRD